MATNQGLKSFIPDPVLVDADYLYRWLDSRRSFLQSLGRGATFKEISKAITAEIEIPLPPIEEQRRIAAVLDQADDLRAKRRASLALLDSVTESIFLELERNSPASLATRCLAELGAIQGGLQVTGARAGYPIDVPYLRVANVHRGRLDLSVLTWFRTTRPELDRTRLQLGDLLVVEGHGNAAEIGRVARWNGSVDPCTHQNHLIRVRLDPELADSVFVEAALNSRKGRQTLLGAARTTSGLNTISVRDVKNVSLVLPSIEVQRRFSMQITQLGEVARSHCAHLAELDALFASLQHRAFAGQL